MFVVILAENVDVYVGFPSQRCSSSCRSVLHFYSSSVVDYTAMYLSLPSLSFAFHAFASLRGTPQRETQRHASPAKFQHEAVQVLEERQLAGPPTAFSRTTPPAQILTFLTPSPSATPIAITRQSQVETSFVPQLTLCALPPLAFYSGSWSVSATSGPRYQNLSVSVPSGSGTCQTMYSPTPTTICATVLTGIATRITVSDCEQDITFSTDYGYTLVTPTATANASAASDSSPITPAPSIRTLTTYYLAPWQSLTAAEQQPTDVEKKICNTFANGTTQCVDISEVWEVQIVTMTATTVSHVDLTTTLPGPAKLMIETIHMDITETAMTLSLSTALVLHYELETTTTSTITRTVPRTLTGPTQTVTETLEENPALYVHRAACCFPSASPLTCAWQSRLDEHDHHARNAHGVRRHRHADDGGRTDAIVVSLPVRSRSDRLR